MILQWCVGSSYQHDTKETILGLDQLRMTEKTPGLKFFPTKLVIIDKNHAFLCARDSEKFKIACFDTTSCLPGGGGSPI